MHRLETDVWVPASIDAVWNFFTDPENLKRLTPPETHPDIQVLEPMSKIRIQATPLAPLPFRVDWMSELSEIEAEGDRRRFVDIQTSGPFKSWRHEHIFEAGDASAHGSRSDSQLSPKERGTWVLDRVDYEVPGGMAGEIAHRLTIRRQIENLFAYRRKVLREVFP